jgi:uncharacterized protein (DUF983 family)
MPTTTETHDGRPTLAQAMLNGFIGRCPRCGEGRLFGRFVKVRASCPVCGEEFHHHRADDLPAYLVIFIVGHVFVPVILAVETMYTPAYWIHAVLWLPLLVGAAIGLLQPVKGAVVGLQWSAGMHGFEAAKRARAAEAAA